MFFIYECSLVKMIRNVRTEHCLRVKMIEIDVICTARIV
jgi:hypothetical protein